jgi:predicted nucleic-acid-binding protein
MAPASVDANVLLDWLLERDQARLRAIGHLFQESRELHVADLIVTEVVYVLQTQAKLSRRTISDFVSRIMNEPVFNCNRTMIRRALKAYESEQALSWVDCCALVYADLQNASPLYTHDKQLIKKSAGKAKAP